MTKLMAIIKKLIDNKFTGQLRISFHYGTLVKMQKLEKYGDVKE